MKTKIFLSLLLIFFAATVNAAKVEKDITINVNGTARTYKLYVPASVNVSEATPMVFSLHGTGGHSSDKSPFKTDIADKKGCIVVYPQGSQIYFPVFGSTLPGWHSVGETSEDIDFFKAIIEQVDSTYNIDRERIYCCGFSNGGMMTYTVANVASDIFAAFASISGYPINEFHLHHTSARPVPFLHIHGKADDFVKYSLMPSIVDDMVARLGAKPVPEKTSVKGKYDKSVYAATEGGFPYVYYEIDGMGHNDYTSNTEDGNSALTMWNFMSQYTLSSPCDTTMKWKPNLETEGFMPKSHGWMMNTATTALLFGKDQKTDANQNVYRSLQFENGKYKICFKSQGPEGKQLTVKLVSLTTKKVVLNKKVNVGEDATVFFDITNGWDEFKFTVLRESASDAVTITNLGIYSATAEEEASAIVAPRQVNNKSNCRYNLAGVKTNDKSKRIQVVDGKKIFVR